MDRGGQDGAACARRAGALPVRADPVSPRARRFAARARIVQLRFPRAARNIRPEPKN
jgi:hypothetical protein